MRTVPASDWDLSALGDDNRRERLLLEISPADLVQQLAIAGKQALQNRQIELDLERAIGENAPADTFRVVTQIPVGAPFFDQLFNGRCGYRAQYYLSPEEGEAFGQLIAKTLEPIVCGAITEDSDMPQVLISKSMLGPHSKIWPLEEKAAFDEAEPGTLRPSRWVASGYGMGRGSRLPLASGVDVKGSFVKPDGSYWLSEDKLDRSMELHTKGFT